MLLKVMNYEIDGWWMLDGVKSIEKSTNDFLQEDTDMLIFCCGGKNAVVLTCILENGGTFVVMFDTTAYLLNNTGKTIEKLFVNKMEKRLMSNSNSASLRNVLGSPLGVSNPLAKAMKKSA